jgi:hypothetical protein
VKFQIHFQYKLLASIESVQKLHLRHLNGWLGFSNGLRVIAVPNVKNKPKSRKNPWVLV